MIAMRIAAFMKYVLDPDAIARHFHIDSATGAVSTPFPRYRFDQYDQIALEIALDLRERHPADIHVTAACAAPKAAEDRLREALAIKASEAVLIDTEGKAFDDWQRARLLANWAKSEGNISIVMCGRMASDTDTSEFGPALAEMLGWPLFTKVTRIERRDDRIVCKRETDDGYEWRFVDAPFVASCTSAPDHTSRKARLPEVMRAQKMTIGAFDASDFKDGAEPNVTTIRSFVPVLERTCQKISGDDPKEAVEELLRRIAPFLD